MGLAATLYFLVGSSGYITFRGRVAGDVLRNFGAANVTVRWDAWQRLWGVWCVLRYGVMSSGQMWWAVMKDSLGTVQQGEDTRQASQLVLDEVMTIEMLWGPCRAQWPAVCVWVPHAALPAPHAQGLRGAYERALKLCFGLSILGSVPLVILPFYNILIPLLGFGPSKTTSDSRQVLAPCWLVGAFIFL